MEYYSTVLWHMRKEMELSQLAQEGVALDRLSPYAWCVMGNCFSLQKVRADARLGCCCHSRSVTAALAGIPTPLRHGVRSEQSAAGGLQACPGGLQACPYRRPHNRRCLDSPWQEHETALRYFQRALQLDAALPYAYTLCGHEYFANEDFDKGVTCYRNAIRIDPRHYNAW